MFVEDKPLYKIDPFSIGAYVNNCVNEKLFSHCKVYWNDKDMELFVDFVFNKIEIHGNRPEDSTSKCFHGMQLEIIFNERQMITDSYAPINGILQQGVHFLFVMQINFCYF